VRCFRFKKYELLRDIVSRCYYLCKKINAGDSVGFSNYLFNDENNNIKLLDKYLFFRQNGGNETFRKEISEFKIGEDIRVLHKLSNYSKVIDENAVLVFITDSKGCELSNELKKKYRRISKQSIWFKIDCYVYEINMCSVWLKRYGYLSNKYKRGDSIMKFGLRKPSIKKSIKARTTGKFKRKVKRAINPFYGKKGMGWIRDPKKAVYNKIYNKTSFSFWNLFK